MAEENPSIHTTTAATLRRSGSIDWGRPALPREAPLAVEVNDVVVAHLMRLPGHDAELALGFCYTEGLIAGLADVLTMEVCRENEGKVRLRTSREVRVTSPLLLTSACVGPQASERADLPEPLGVDGPRVDAEALLDISGRMRPMQEIHEVAGAVHGAAVFTPGGELVVLREDVGRHNAIDKVIGSCMYEGRQMARSVLVSTGRASSEMMLKAARARLPIAVSLSGPTSLGVELADRLGITLVCYLRRSRMTVYTHLTRIDGLESR